MFAVAPLALALVAGLLVSPSAAAAAPPDRPAVPAAPQDRPAPAPADGDARDRHVQSRALPPRDRAPLPASRDELRRDYDDATGTAPRPRPSMRARSGPAAAAVCNVSDFTSRTGSALVQQIRASTTDCVNTLFSLTGGDAYAAFREAQMASVAYGLRDNAVGYDGTNATGTAQLVLYLRAGYYVQWYNPSTVGSYGPTLQTAIRAGLDTFFGNSRSGDVSDANGETLAEAVTLIDSSAENARYLYVVKRLLTGYNSSYHASWWMLNAVNNVYIVLFRGHQVPTFVTAVTADPSITDTLYAFASTNRALLGTDNGYLASNAGRELGRFLQHSALRGKVRPLARGLLDLSAITGPTAALWVGVAEMTDYYDQANCAYYNTCNLQQRLADAVLPITYTCGSSIRIRAQQMSSTELAWACTSMRNQDAYFHSVVADSGPVAGDLNATLEVVVFDSSTDYQTYGGPMFGIDTNNGGMYLEGNPSAVGNQPRFIAYEAEWLRPTFEIWNLNHEYTHYLDGRFDMYGDFTANISTPTIWWIEGFAEYVSYSYRNLTYTAAITEAGRRTYSLRTLFDTTYSHDTTRVYRWGYLAVRYMLQSHRSDVTTLLGHYRTGNWSAARTLLTSTIGSRYDTDWYAWLDACAAGNCGGGTNPPANQPPTAAFTVTTSNLTASFTDRSTDSDGTVATRSWDFGDGTTSTATNPTRTYQTAGTYTVTLTVTDNQGAVGRTSQTVTVSGTGVTECTDSDTRVLGKNCQRSGASATTGNYAYFYLYLPAGTTTLRITSTGGTGEADLYYNASTWATTSAYTQRSTNTGNGETITVTNPAAGYRYISLHARQSFSGVSVKTEY
ncbi:PKD domain-containing protein [Micromonospora echinofusca]|uniref:microbial collagenase n=1 Tax=Micromonospora echinofusca TaxID=47858 RepID=A0ABS3VZR9_MICEH|nr:PKD domain-containing protein [Micromonospora echinofusca]